MTTARRLDALRFPSETGWLLMMLAITVAINAWTMAGWLTSSGSVPWTQVVMLVAPGLATTALFSRWRVKRSKPLSDTPFREAGKVIEDLAEDVSLSLKPQVRFNKDLGARAYVYGIPAQPYLVLGPELLALHSMGGAHRTAFEAVIRHELAHLRAGDLTKLAVVNALRFTNVYCALWLVFILALFTAADVTVGQLVVGVVRGIGLVLLAELIARTFLRVREHHADLMAAEGGREALRAALSGGPDVSTARQWLRRHPGRRERVAAVERSTVVLASGPGQVFLGATTAGVALISLQDKLLAGGPRSPQDLVIVAALTAVPFVVFLAFTQWRAVWDAATNRRATPLLFAAAVFGGLLLGSHLSPYTRVSGFGPTGIPLDFWLLVSFAAGAVALCLWLQALGIARQRTDPGARRLGRFLFLAGAGAAIGGGWLITALWSWATRILALRIGCTDKDAAETPICLPDAETEVVRSILRGFVFSPWLVIAVAVVAVSLVIPGLVSRRRAPRWQAVAGVVALAGAVVVALSGPGARIPKSRAEIRPVVQSVTKDDAVVPDELRFECPKKPDAQANAPLLTCSNDSTEKFALGTAELAADDFGTATSGPSQYGGVELTLTFTDAGAKRWEELTGRSVGKRLAIVVGGKVAAAPQVQGPISGGTTSLTGTWSSSEATKLVALINGE